MARELPQLVFATRSPDPKTGSDFVRQVVAETPGVSEEARQEFSRRADLAGSVLQYQPQDPQDPLRVFLFQPLSDDTWLFARAVSLGLYRKGSHQLLVHGVVLDEETLDGLEANPLALDTALDASDGFRFLDRHPGREAQLAPMRLGPDAFHKVRAHNRRRLHEIPAADDRWIAAAYDALAAGERVACITADPHPVVLEQLLLHLHPDDRLEIGFNTFYSHSRPVEYRLITVLPGDAATARHHFRGIRPVGLDDPRPTAGGLGALACALRRSSRADFLHAVHQALVAHLSHRRRQPLAVDDAALVFRAGLTREPLTATESERLEVLFQRAGGGLAYLVVHLATRWAKDGDELEKALDATTRADEKISRDQFDRYLEGHLEESPADHRWALAALLTRPDAFEVDVPLAQAERLHLWRRLLSRRSLDNVRPQQIRTAETILGQWAQAHAEVGSPADEPADWAILLRCLHGWQRPTVAQAKKIEETLIRRQEVDTALTWRRLGDVYRDLGETGEARRVLFTREIPRTPAEDAHRLVAVETDRLLAEGGHDLLDLAPYFGQPGVARAVFGRLADLALQDPPWEALRLTLERANRLDPDAAESAGRVLAAILVSSKDGDEGRWLLDRCRSLPTARDRPDAFAASVLQAAATSLVAECESVGMADDKQPRLTAVAVLLERRLDLSTAFGADTELMRLAVRGRILAAEARSNAEKSAAERLDQSWRPFLRLASRGSVFDQPTGDEALMWLDLLQDELFADPPKPTDDDVALAVFFDLAWSLWGRSRTEEPDADSHHDSLSFKLRWAARLESPNRQGWLPAVLPGNLRRRGVREREDRQQRRILKRVPRRYRRDAEKLLEPLTLQTPLRASSR